MPQTQKLSTPDIGIQIEGKPRFAPGDTISGNINRTTHIVAPRARVTVTLHGRTKAKVSPSSRNDSTHYRTSFRLLNARTTTQVVFDGPLHIERGRAAAWPFAMQIPRLVDPAATRSSGQEEASYEPLGRKGRPLPGSFSFCSTGFSSSLEAFVEYYLEAKLYVYHENRAREECFATLPVSLRMLQPGPPIADFNVRSQDCFKWDKFISHHLVPGCEDMRLSSHQKLRRFFHSRQVPHLTVKYEVEAPGVIQLGHSTPIPFFLRAIPIWSSTSEILQNVPQKIRIDSIHVEITSYTEAKAMGSLYAHSADGKSRITLGNYSHVEGREAHLPFLPDDPPLDIGKLMDLRPGYGGLTGRLYPSFKAFNINHGHHQLSWRVRVSVAGEKSEITVRKPVSILPASNDGEVSAGGEPPPPFVEQRTESWAVPPPDNEVPPAYSPADKAQGGDVPGESLA